ncbi:LacI family DNA-binding transcriptional regulator [Gorillibacterium massiliense]|uniref:LacI family DNA-binding transcriptional regulator n=1 Tax=Gorillibacterium massiliense TaxID=1280390 RepID=UPI0004B40D1E|nr:LacI family DNA-binding transcriptional regulator [Gorillibacterium massiliense]
MAIASRKEVAERAGVSEATVSRVLNGVGPMKEETRQRVLAVAEELGYTPSAIARSFAKSKSGNIGVVVPYLSKARIFSAYYFSEILSGIGSAVREVNNDLLLLFREPGKTMDYESIFRMQKVDGMIILGAKEEPGERDALRRLQEEGRPFILINQRFAGESFPEIDADHVAGSRSAVRHLLGRGYRRIAFLNGPSEYSNSQDRMMGYAQALYETGIELDEGLLFQGNFSRTSGISAAKAIAPLLGRIDAIFAANDRMAIGLQQGFRELGVTKDVIPAMAGYDDSDVAVLGMPPLTSVRVPFYELGLQAAAYVLKEIGGDLREGDSPQPFHHKLPTELVIRASSQKEEKR